MSRQPDQVDAEYLAHAARLFAPIKQRSYELMGAAPGRRLLDVGCGAGMDTLALGHIVGPDGSVAGVDQDADMIVLARQKASIAGLDERVVHQQADAERLPFADAEFDGVRAERLFMHLRRPLRVLGEMLRVTRPRGRIVAVETDWGSLSCGGEPARVERRLGRYRAEQVLANGYAGRSLYGWCKRAGLASVAVAATALFVTRLDVWRYLTRQDELIGRAAAEGVLGQAETQAWQESLRELDRRSAFFGSVNVVTVAGTRP